MPGDLLVAGTWRGGEAIFMRAVLEVLGDPVRAVWVADSFKGLPPPDPDNYPADAGDTHHTFPELAVSLAEVKANFARYGMLDDRVRFLEGWFKDTLADAPIGRLAVLRCDGDMYESTMDTLRPLYPKVSPGGFVIVDDYGCVPACKQAVDDYRREHDITDPIETIDWTGVYWRKTVKECDGGVQPRRRRAAGRAKTAVASTRALGRLVRRGDYRKILELARRMVAPMDPEYRRRYRMTLKGWLLYHQSEIVYEKSFWMGVPAQKNPMDSWIYQEILHEVQPDVVIEIGSAAGGSTLYFAHLLDLIGHGKVISVDVDRSRFDVSHDRIVALTGRSDDPEILQRLARECAGKRVVVVHDGDHTRDQVLIDLNNYAKFVSPGGYLIVEDGIVDLFRPTSKLGQRKPGPMRAIEEFLKANPNFEVDKSRERYLLTYNPRGFLRRVR